MHPLLFRHRQKISLPDDLQALFDGETGLQWFFSPSDLRYYSFRAGVLNSRISGFNLPDPDALFANKCSMSGIRRDSSEALALRPTLDTYKLWQDWTSRSNNA